MDSAIFQMNSLITEDLLLTITKKASKWPPFFIKGYACLVRYGFNPEPDADKMKYKKETAVYLCLD